jgi:ferritin-like protein
MTRPHATTSPRRLTRGQLLAAGLAGATGAGAMALVERHYQDASAAQPSATTDAEIFNAFLTLEYAQQRYYDAALRAGGLSGELETLTRAFAGQEAEHIAVLQRLLGSRARRPGPADVAEASASPEAFRARAIDLEEAVVAAYIGQAANLTRKGIIAIAPMVSVEARQVAWLRDLADMNAAPRAADRARPVQDVVADLHREGLIA